MWSLSLFTIATIFIAVFWREDSIARRTFIRSIGDDLVSKRRTKTTTQTKPRESSPASLRGLATITWIHHSSQQTSSSVCPPPPRRPSQPVVMPVFRRLRSKNRTTISPREPPAAELAGDWGVSWETRRLVWESIAVEISGGSRMEGRVMGRVCVECDDA